LKATVAFTLFFALFISLPFAFKEARGSGTYLYYQSEVVIGSSVEIVFYPSPNDYTNPPTITIEDPDGNVVVQATVQPGSEWRYTLRADKYGVYKITVTGDVPLSGSIKVKPESGSISGVLGLLSGGPFLAPIKLVLTVLSPLLSPILDIFKIAGVMLIVLLLTSIDQPEKLWKLVRSIIDIVLQIAQVIASLLPF